jgi:putative colanic acid biosynthesis glycosyltransferase
LTIVPVSNWLEELVKKSYLKNKKTQVINNGINLDNFYPKENNTDIRIKFGVKDCFMLLGVASSWGKRKGLDDFIKLSNLINKDIIIVLVGVDKSQIESLPSNIIGIERTENVSQLAEIYSAADLYLNLTYEDNFPTTNLEALACGTPVLTYNTGGSIEAVSIDTGFIVEKGDVKGIENAIDQIKMRGKEFYSNSCVERVNEYYNKNDRFRDYLDLYNSEINQLK